MNTPAAINPWQRIFAPFAVGYFLSYLLRNANAVISPELTRDLGLSAADLGLLTSAYLLTFGAFQLPLGILLDRYGPRRVEAGLLLFCAAGCALFASGIALPQLALGRALIGLGVSACLMASFKAFSLWFPVERQASLNAAIMAAGGLGALAASSPLGAVLPLLGWRGIFYALAALTLIVATLIFTTPDKTTPAAQESLRQQLAGLAAIFASPRILALCAADHLHRRRLHGLARLVGGTLADDGEWRDARRGRVSSAADGRRPAGRLSRHRLLRHPSGRRRPAARPAVDAGHGRRVAGDAGDRPGSGPKLVALAGARAGVSVGNLAYALLTAQFPLTLAGRANTALNLGAFVGAFGIQWLFGVAVDSFQSGGLDAPSSYRASLTGLLVLQTAGWLWFIIAGRRADIIHKVVS